jgi:Domain of unknown function (DUF4383)
VDLGGGDGRRRGRARGCRRIHASARDAAEVRPPTLRPYLALLGAALLGQGLASWALDWSGRGGDRSLYRFANADPLHAFIHVVWGGVMIVLVARPRGERFYARLALAFGVFYTALAALGIVVHHPFGLRLDLGENVFHLIVGPITLALALAAMRLERLPA